MRLIAAGRIVEERPRMIRLPRIHLSACLLCVALGAQAQTTAVPATSGQVAFLRHIFRTIADPQHDPAVRKMNEDAVITRYGLNAQEAASLHAVGQSFAAALTSFQSQESALLAGITVITDDDRAAVATLSAQLGQAEIALANQILNAVRPQTAILLRRQGDVIAQFTGTAREGN